VFERTHKGVLLGAPLTDIKVTLLAGRAHLKHTEGGDFRQATYRAIRNALMQAKNVLMEPVCTFSMRAPAEAMGRLLGDLNKMRAKTELPQYEDEEIFITGEAVFAQLNAYQTEFASVTHGRGALVWQLSHYEPCAEQERIVEERGYRPLADEPADSVFCAKGAGFTVPWDEVRAYAHLTSEANP
jgi:translation elongation factor EF-G